jgi:hypothetical protein
MEENRRKWERKEGMEEDVVKRMEEEGWQCRMNAMPEMRGFVYGRCARRSGRRKKGWRKMRT